ncbi:unnamed protein product [Lactuca virosa]|uniref:Auxin-responsive protein n=1 Tax=Lactuca virosa TaxID=75947 RepID=A0AAU9N2V3_9ASTR|nr:unnamed protein product [Lactuca virosa]
MKFHIKAEMLGLVLLTSIPVNIVKGETESRLKPKDGNCKIFGVPLAGNRNISADASTHQYHIFDSDQSKRLKVNDNNPSKEQDKEYQHFQQAKLQGVIVSTRSCTKVHKQGIALGRSVDLAKFNDYDELIAELDVIFEFNGELKTRNKNWLVVYTDDEGDMMLVGDDPWQEFCGMVRKIFIYTREEENRERISALIHILYKLGRCCR